MRDTHEEIVAFEVEELDTIAIHCLKNSPCVADVQTRAVNATAIDNIHTIIYTRSHSLRELLQLDHFNKGKAIHVDRIINK